jgi:predicted ATP-grasp superfamily ATP-dependent carboligase
MIHSRKEAITIERTIAKVAILLLAFPIIELAGDSLAATKVVEITGEIVSVNISTNMLTVKTKRGEMDFKVNEKTQITMGKEQKQLSDLKPGEKVKVYYTVVEGEELAEMIMVKVPTKK